MKTNKDIFRQVEEAFTSLDTINEVKISASFKQNILNELNSTPKEKVLFPWFTPQLQFAAMIIVLLVNVSAIMYTFSTEDQTSDIDTFAQEYHFDTEETFNIN